MSSAGAEYSAPILEALGMHDAAAMLRATGELIERNELADMTEERDALQIELDEAEERAGAFADVVDAALELLAALDDENSSTAARKALRKAIKATVTK